MSFSRTPTARGTRSMIAAKRARQINDYHNSLGENTFSTEDFLPPLITTRSTNLLTISFEEIAENKIEYSISDV